ncbi:LuxR C-terminal-related transcriptional regulator [Microbacterium sp. A84]|uniref:LuxR C-terminal-related transcriptional regulator n=1 Tax=Microbacterium sp. A84 TaxID=3450715 RepID=UPI003F436A7E
MEIVANRPAGSLSAADRHRPKVYFAPVLEGATLVRERFRAPILSPEPAPRLVLVHGPAGTGKTTTLAQWARSTAWDAPPTIWVSMHDDDHGRIHFWTRVITTVQESRVAAGDSHFARFDTTVLAQFGMRSTLVRLFSSLANRIIVVIDDFHLIDEAAIDDDVITLLESTSSVTFVLASRARSPLDSTQTAARIPMTVVDATSFAFTLNETHELLELHRGSEPVATASSIFEQTGGWPLATRALALTHGNGHSPALVRSVRDGHARFVSDYIGTLLARLNEDARHLLLVTSVCAEFSLSFAASIGSLPRTRTAAAIRQLKSLGVTTKRPTPQGTVFAHHPYMREALKRTAEEELDDEQLAEIRRQYSSYVEPGRPDQALSILCVLGDLDAANAVLTRNYPILTSVHAARTAAVLRDIPAVQLAAYPILLSALWIHAHSNPAVPLAWLDGWFDLLNTAVHSRVSDESALPFTESAVLTGLYRLMGQSDDAVRMADIVSAQLANPATPAIPDARNSLPMIHAVLALTRLFAGDYANAERHYVLCATDAQAKGLPLDAVRGLNGQALATAISGDVASARIRIAEAESFDALADWDDHFGRINLRIARAWVAIDAFDSDAALREITALRHHERAAETWPFIALAEARALLYSHCARTAESALDAAISRHETRPEPIAAMRASLTAMRATLALYQGDVRRARTILHGADLNHPELELARARVSLLAGNSKAALMSAARTLQHTREHRHGAHRMRLEAMLITAVAELRLGLQRKSEETTRHAFSSLVELQLATPLAKIPRSDLELLIANARIDTADPAIAALLRVPDLFASVGPNEELSETELRVLMKIAAEKTTEKTARSLFISPNTVKHHLKSIYRKLGAGSRQEAFDIAVTRGLIDGASVTR